MIDPVAFAIELIRRVSITPEDDGCQDFLESVLSPLGFQRMRVDAGGVTNSIFYRPGERAGCLAFAGHTDVVPPGPLDAWRHPPFDAVVEDGILHGRGAQDMKGAIACWLAAVCELAGREPLPTLQLLITSDEEGESIDGTVRIVERLKEERMLPDAALVGEPSCKTRVGDTIRRGRRGVIQGEITVKGKQGHSAYPDQADNAIHRAIPIFSRILAIDWGEAAEGFPPTTCQITNVNAGCGAVNVIPGELRATLDVRYNPSLSFEEISSRLAGTCARLPGVELSLQHQAAAFSTPDGPFLDLVCRCIEEITAIQAIRDTGGGTSDGRFLAEAGIPVVELGLTNSTIHQTNECVALEELTQLTRIYRKILCMFGGKPCH